MYSNKDDEGTDHNEVTISSALQDVGNWTRVSEIYSNEPLTTPHLKFSLRAQLVSGSEGLLLVEYFSPKE